MSPSVDLSVSTRARQLFVVGVLVLVGAPVLGSMFAFVADLLGVAGGTTAVAAAFGLGAVVAVATGVGLFVRVRNGESGSVWHGIPSEHYTGRLSESGGLAQIEQERAIDRLKEEDQ